MLNTAHNSCYFDCFFNFLMDSHTYMITLSAKHFNRAYMKDPILDKDTELVPVMHARGTSGSAKRICCIGK